MIASTGSAHIVGEDVHKQVALKRTVEKNGLESNLKFR